MGQLPKSKIEQLKREKREAKAAKKRIHKPCTTVDLLVEELEYPEILLGMV